MLFKPEFIELIKSGRKTQTRRLWKTAHVRVGGVYDARTKLFERASVFARIQVLSLRREKIAEISEDDARAEGFASRVEFLKAFRRINQNKSRKAGRGLAWVVTFRYVGPPRGKEAV